MALMTIVSILSVLLGSAYAIGLCLAEVIKIFMGDLD